MFFVVCLFSLSYPLTWIISARILVSFITLYDVLKILKRSVLSIFLHTQERNYPVLWIICKSFAEIVENVSKLLNILDHHQAVIPECIIIDLFVIILLQGNNK